MNNAIPQRIEAQILRVDADITSLICEEFEAIEGTGDYLEFFRKYHMLPYGWLNFEADTIAEDDYFGIRNVIYLMLRLRELATSKTVADDELTDAGISVHSFGIVGTDETKRQVRGGEAGLRVPIRGKAYARYLLTKTSPDYSYNHEESFDEIPETVLLGYSENDGTDAHEQPDARAFLTREGGAVVLHLREYVEVWESLENGPSNAHYAAAMLDSLCSLHLEDVETVTRDGIPYQRTSLGISALWLAYCNKLSHSRIASCAACGKPMLISGERGTPRRYCDDTCRKWANRNPGKKRAMRIRS